MMEKKNKPDACIGCPLYEYGDEFVEDSLPEGVRILVVWDVPSKDNAAAGRAGNTGQDHTARSVNAMRFAKMKRPYDTGFAHVLRCRKYNPPTQRSPARPAMPATPSGKALKEAAAHCRIYDEIPDTVETIVAYGPIAWKVLTDGVGARSKWRGYYHERTVDDGDYNEAQLNRDVHAREDHFLQPLTEAEAPDDDGDSDSDTPASGDGDSW